MSNHPHKPEAIHITGMGLVSPAEVLNRPLWDFVSKKESLIRNGVGRIEQNDLMSFVTKVFKDLPFSKEIEILAEEFPRSKPRLLSLLSLAIAMKNAGWEKLEETDGIVFATTTGHVGVWEGELMKFLKKEISENDFFKSFQFQPLHLSIDAVSKQINFKGQTRLISSACSAGTQAIQIASNWLRSERIRRCLVGGTEVLSQLTLRGFDCFQLLSPSPCKPFDQNRTGINLSEASGFLCLEKQSSQKSLALIAGGGMATDAYHMTSPSPEGRGLATSVTNALRNANLSADQIDWIHAHGTGSKANDAAEVAALKSVFKNRSPELSSTKGVHGHALGASGILETILCVEALKNQKAPGTTGLQEIDRDLAMSPLVETKSMPLNYILKTTLGFGGTNAALILSRPETSAA